MEYWVSEGAPVLRLPEVEGPGTAFWKTRFEPAYLRDVSGGVRPLDLGMRSSDWKWWWQWWQRQRTGKLMMKDRGAVRSHSDRHSDGPPSRPFRVWLQGETEEAGDLL